jgi:hypothetical protein
MSANVTVPNFPIFGVDHFMALWKLTRAMKAAGWKYLGSGDATNKDITAISSTNGSPLTDTWGPGGIVANHVQLGSQTGSGATITVTSPLNTVTVSGLSGMTTASVGHALQISGAANAVNNGIFTIVARSSSSSVTIFNPVAVSEGTSLTWSERINGTSSITWSAKSGREQTISGLTKMTPNSAGRYIYLEGSSLSNNNGIFSIISYISPSSIKIINNNTTSVGSDTASGNWTELDPLLDIYPLTTNLGSGSWILFQGPSTLKIPISSASVGTFTNNEIVTQSGSSATGELLGYQFDSSLGIGYLVVMPRTNGSGGGRLGWGTGISTITGSTSSATVTTGTYDTPIEFVREVVFWKYTNQLQGTIYNQCVDAVNESSYRFSTLAASGNCTAIRAPGGGGVGNIQSSIGTYVVKGSNVNYNSSRNWFCPSPDVTSGTQVGLTRANFMVADADYSSNKSADGTFTVAVGNPGPWGGTSTTASDNNYPPRTGCYSGFGFYRLDNTEYGDVDPYVWYVPSGSVASPNLYNDPQGGQTFDVPTGSQSNYVYADHFNSSTLSTTSNPASLNYSGIMCWTVFKGFRRRGFSVYNPSTLATTLNGDSYQQFQTLFLCIANSIVAGSPIPGASPPTTTWGKPLMSKFLPSQDVFAHSLSPTPKKIRESIWIASLQEPTGNPPIGGRMRKGTLRWVTVVSGGCSGQTFDNKLYVQLSSSQGNNGSMTTGNSYAPLQGNWVVGPWDGMSPLLKT